MESDEVSYGNSSDDDFLNAMENETSTHPSTDKTAEVRAEPTESDARILARTPRFPGTQSKLSSMFNRPAEKAREDARTASVGSIQGPGLCSTEMMDAVFNKASATPSAKRQRVTRKLKAEDPAALRESKKLKPRHSTDPKSASAIQLAEDNPNQGLYAGLNNKLICRVSILFATIFSCVLTTFRFPSAFGLLRP